MRLLRLVTRSQTGLYGGGGGDRERLCAGLLQPLLLAWENYLPVSLLLVPASFLDRPGMEWSSFLELLPVLLPELFLLGEGDGVLLFCLGDGEAGLLCRLGEGLLE